MNTFTKLILVPASFVALITCATPVFASCDGITNSSLTEEQLLTLKQNCVKIEKDAKAAAEAAAATPAPILDKEHLEEYADLGKKYGIALSEVAKSVGTTVNELAQTPVGIFMLVMVGWKVLGHDIVNIVGGSMFYLFVVSILGHYFNKLVLKDRKTKETFDPSGKGLLSREVQPLDWNNGQSGAAWILGILFVLMTIVTIIVVF